jgi:hypothetical protein
MSAQDNGQGSGQGQNQNNGGPNQNPAFPRMNQQDHNAIAEMVANITFQQNQNQNQNQPAVAAQTQPYNPRMDEVGVFDQNPQDAEITGSGITSVGRPTVYTNIYAFTDRLRELAGEKGDKAVQENWTSWLRGEGIGWHTHELSDLERELLANASLDSICSALIKRFKESASSAMKNMGKIKFGVSNLQRGETIRSFAQTMFCHAEAAEMGSDYLQLAAAYSALEYPVQAHCPIPTPEMSKRKWLEEVDLRSTLFEGMVERANANARRFPKGKQEVGRGSPRFGPRPFQNQFQNSNSGTGE